MVTPFLYSHVWMLLPPANEVTARKLFQSCVSVIVFTEWCLHVTSTDDAIGLSQVISQPWPYSPHHIGTPQSPLQYSPPKLRPPQTCSNLYILDLIIQAHHSNMLKLACYVVRTIGKRSVCIRLNCLLVVSPIAFTICTHPPTNGIDCVAYNVTHCILTCYELIILTTIDLIKYP